MKGIKWELQTGNPKNIVGTQQEYTDPGKYIPNNTVPICSYYVVAVPCFEVPIKVPFNHVFTIATSVA